MLSTGRALFKSETGEVLSRCTAVVVPRFAWIVLIEKIVLLWPDLECQKNARGLLPADFF